MKFTVFDLSHREIVSDRDDVRLHIFIEPTGIIRWQVVDNSDDSVIAENCGLFYITMDFTFHKGAR
jgi:hypothetical protein